MLVNVIFFFNFWEFSFSKLWTAPFRITASSLVDVGVRFGFLWLLSFDSVVCFVRPRRPGSMPVFSFVVRIITTLPVCTNSISIYWMNVHWVPRMYILVGNDGNWSKCLRPRECGVNIFKKPPVMFMFIICLFLVLTFSLLLFLPVFLPSSLSFCSPLTTV